MSDPAPRSLLLLSQGRRSPAQTLRALVAGARDEQLVLRLRRARAAAEPFRHFLLHLPRGPACRGSLRRLFLAAAREGTAAEGAAILGARFDLLLDGGTVPWCWPSLLRLWQVLGALPESAVARNPALRRLCRVDTEDGFGVYHARGTGSHLGPGSAEISAFRLDRESTDYRLPLNSFSATVLHEVGHAVASRLGLHDTLYQGVPHSPWVFQGDRRAFLRRLLNSNDEADACRLGELYLDQPPGRERSLRRALELLHREQRQAGSPAAPRSLLQHPGLRNLAHNSRHAVPCYHRLRPLPAGLVYYYDSGYRRGFAYIADRHAATQVSAYQFRAPNEWFAELYAVYYAHGDRPGAGLRRLDRPLREIAAWFDARVHLTR